MNTPKNTSYTSTVLVLVSAASSSATGIFHRTLLNTSNNVNVRWAIRGARFSFCRRHLPSCWFIKLHRHCWQKRLTGRSLIIFALQPTEPDDRMSSESQARIYIYNVSVCVWNKMNMISCLRGNEWDTGARENAGSDGRIQVWLPVFRGTSR